MVGRGSSAGRRRSGAGRSGRKGRGRSDKALMRTCLMTRQQQPRERLLRFVLDSESRLTEDLAGRLPGRGLYVTPDRQHVEKMIGQPGRMRHALGQSPQHLDAEALLSRLESGLIRRLQDGLGLARRAGLLRAGMRLVEESQGDCVLLLLAMDTAHHTREKFERQVRRLGVEALEVLDRRRLGDAIGSGPVAVLAVMPGGIERRIRLDVERWRKYVDDGSG
ncbi:MAG: DUF448 domain-containing protein [Magnetococcales bacterium]|nr:DUF448 domain-containing protein [Magnetococcales bacterium]